MLQHKHCIGGGSQFRKAGVSLHHSVNDDNHPVTNCLHLRQDMRRKQNRGLGRKALDQVSDFNNLRRVEAHSGLIQNQQPRPVQDGLRQPHALPKALAKLRNWLRQALCQSSGMNCLRKQRRLIALGYLPQVSNHFQIVLHREFTIERRAFGQVTNPRLHLLAVVEYIQPVHLHTATVSLQVAGQNLN